MIDEGVIKDSKKAYINYWAIVIVFWVIWFNTLETRYNPYLFTVFYATVVGVGCGTWVFVQLSLAVKSKKIDSLVYLVIAGILGFLGFYPVLKP